MNILFLPKMNMMYIITSSTNNGVNEMKMSVAEFNQFKEAAEKTFQAELICSLLEDHPHQLGKVRISRSFLPKLTR